MATECYAQVRGAALRVTGLRPCGTLPDPISYAVATCVSRVTINEEVESGSNEVLKSETDEPRLHFARSPELIRYTVDMDFLRVDPGLLSLVAGVGLVRRPGNKLGFGEAPFGVFPFGDGVDDGSGDVIGFDAKTRLPAAAFGLEVWSRLTGQACADGVRKYGYTLFPYLRGGYLSGFTFANGLVSFNLRGAQTRRGSGWGRGPYDLEATQGVGWDEGGWDVDGWDETSQTYRLAQPVSGNTLWRNLITTAPPPEQTDGIVEYRDVIDNGTASDPHPLAVGVVDNGTAVDPGLGVVDNGGARF